MRTLGSVPERVPVSYARSGDLRIAYQQFGEGELDVLIAPGFISNLDMAWDMPPFRMIFDRLGSFARWRPESSSSVLLWTNGCPRTTPTSSWQTVLM